MKRFISIFILGCFFVNSIVWENPAYADNFILPAPGVMVQPSPEYKPPILKGIKVHADTPFRFDFILDQGDSLSKSMSSPNVSVGDLHQEQLKTDATRLIKYFLASLTIPEDDLWVNLSPYEKNRIVPESFGKTEMGRDLLAQDYMLKQITASLIYPEGETGKKFWKRIYDQSLKRFGTTNVPVNTFNKVWIIPDKAVIYENVKAGTAYVVQSKLKVMLDQDYLSLEKHNSVSLRGAKGDEAISVVSDASSLGSQVLRQIVIPELTKEVNEGKNFSQLRQVYNSLILATWYKKKIRDSILEQVYADKNKVQGVGYHSSVNMSNATHGGDTLPSALRNDINDVDLIYQRYLQAFKKGVYNYIKEDLDPISQQSVPRKYFSGGTVLKNIPLDFAMTNPGDQAQSDLLSDVSVDFSAVPAPSLMKSDAAMTDFSISSEVGGLAGKFGSQKEFIKAFPFITKNIKLELPVALNALKYIVSLSKHNDGPIIIWQNLSLGELYPYFTEGLKSALGIIEPNEPEDDLIKWFNDPQTIPESFRKAKIILIKLKKPSTWSHLNRTLKNKMLPEDLVDAFARNIQGKVLMTDSSKRSLSRAQEDVKRKMKKGWSYFNPTVKVPNSPISTFENNEFFLRDSPLWNIKVSYIGHKKPASQVAREIFGTAIEDAVLQSDDEAFFNLKKALQNKYSEKAQLAVVIEAIRQELVDNILRFQDTTYKKAREQAVLEKPDVEWEPLKYFHTDGSCKFTSAAFENELQNEANTNLKDIRIYKIVHDNPQSVEFHIFLVVLYKGHLWVVDPTWQQYLDDSIRHKNKYPKVMIVEVDKIKDFLKDIIPEKTRNIWIKGLGNTLLKTVASRAMTSPKKENNRNEIIVLERPIHISNGQHTTVVFTGDQVKNLTVYAKSESGGSPVRWDLTLRMDANGQFYIPGEDGQEVPMLSDQEYSYGQTESEFSLKVLGSTLVVKAEGAAVDVFIGAPFIFVKSFIGKSKKTVGIGGDVFEFEKDHEGALIISGFIKGRVPMYGSLEIASKKALVLNTEDGFVINNLSTGILGATWGDLTRFQSINKEEQKSKPIVIKESLNMDQQMPPIAVQEGQSIEVLFTFRGKDFKFKGYKKGGIITLTKQFGNHGNIPRGYSYFQEENDELMIGMTLSNRLGFESLSADKVNITVTLEDKGIENEEARMETFFRDAIEHGDMREARRLYERFKETATGVGLQVLCSYFEKLLVSEESLLRTTLNENWHAAFERYMALGEFRKAGALLGNAENLLNKEGEINEIIFRSRVSLSKEKVLAAARLLIDGKKKSSPEGKRMGGLKVWERKDSDYYDVLSLPSNATVDEIKKVYRAVSQEVYPDRHPGERLFEEALKILGEAYEGLTKNKTDYDLWYQKRQFGSASSQAMMTSQDLAMSHNSGGIDFTPKGMNVLVKNGSSMHEKGIQFHLNPAQLVALRNSPGFVPVIINIQPMRNLKAFLDSV